LKNAGRAVVNTNLGTVITYSEMGFSWFSSVSPSHYRDSAWSDQPLPIPFHFIVHSSPHHL